MTKTQAISAATERAGHTRRTWFAVTDDGITWWIEPEYQDALDAIECDMGGPIDG